ncbi:MAG: transposase [Actinobacteria bacterium]|nr:transposase [Actinomycetota bacterium]
MHRQQQRPQRVRPPRRGTTRRTGQRQQTPEGRAELRERVAVEHALAHVGYWQGRRARYRGTHKNLFDLRRVAVVHNLHVIARQPDDSRYQLAA